MRPLPYCVYVLISTLDQKFYIGFTTDVRRRLREHNEGHNVSTSKRGRLVLAYCEYHSSEQDARRREKYFKSAPGKRTLKFMLREALPTLRARH